MHEPPTFEDDPGPNDDDRDGGNVVQIDGERAAKAAAALKRRRAKRKADAPNEQTEGMLQGRPWARLLLLNERGAVAATTANAATYLAHDPALTGCFELRERSGAVFWADKPPLPDDLARVAEYPRPISDADLVALAAYLERTHKVSFGGLTLSAAVDAVAARHAVDPVRAYLEGLTWDGNVRLDTWLHDMLGVDDGPYSRAVGAAWMISAVARTYAPGCQADHVLVLEGQQGVGKSSALKVLAGLDEWYADGVPGIGTKDAADALRGPWIVEIAELDAFSRAELGTVKAFVSRRSDRYREAYARRTLDHARRIVFAATTNDNHYLRDVTGARRFWPVACASIDLVSLAASRDQLWAESVARYRAGSPWHLVGDTVAAARAEADERYQGDTWEQVIEAFLSQPGRADSETTVREVAVDALKIDVAKLDQGTQQRIARSLSRIGWTASKNTERRNFSGVQCKVKVYRPAGQPRPTSPQQAEF